MATMRFVSMSIQLDSVTKPAAPKTMSEDLSLHIVRTDSGFILFGQTKEYMLELANFKHHANFQAKLGAIRWQSELSEEETQTLNTLLSTFSVPIMNKTMNGVDGTTYTLTIGKFQTSVSLSWWVAVPEGWHSVADLMAFLYAVAERSLVATAEPLSFQERLQKYLNRFKR